jgi:VHL beta domain
MDPLSIATTAVSLAALTAKLATKAAGYVEQVSTADDTLHILTSELNILGATLTSIDAALRSKELDKAFGKASSSKEVQRHLTALQAILGDCKTALEEFGGILDTIKKGRFSSSIFRKPAAAWKINQKTPHLSRLQHLITGYHRALHIHLQLMSLYRKRSIHMIRTNSCRLISTETSSGLQNVDSSLDEIKTEILRLRFRFNNLGKEADLDGETLTSNSIKQSLAASENILSSASEYLGSTAGTIRINNTSPVNFSASRAAQVEAWIQQKRDDGGPDQQPDAEDDSDTEMISELFTMAESRFDKGEYPNAKRFFSTFLDKADNQSAWDRDQVFEARLKLAACHTTEDDYPDAQLILERVDTASCSLEQSMRLQQHLAEISYLHSDLERAKQHAKRAMKGQDKDTPPYYNSVSLLALICTSLGESEEAEVYQTRIPADFQPSRIVGWKDPDPSQTTAGNPDSSHQQDHKSPDEATQVTEGTLERVENEVLYSISPISVNITFSNDTKYTAISVYWIDLTGGARHVVDLKAGESSSQRSGVNQVWRVVDAAGRVVACYVARGNPGPPARITDEMQLTPLEREVRSGNSSIATNLTFVNCTSSWISVYWIDWNGTAMHYVDVTEGSSNLRPTYTGHVWRVIDRATQRNLASFVALLGDSTVVITEDMDGVTIPL